MFNSRYFGPFFRNTVFSLSVLTTASLSAVGQNPSKNDPTPLFKKLAARDELNKGVKAFRKAHYDEAITRFQKSTELDPDLPMAKQYLGTALASTVVPGLGTPENLGTAERAISIFLEVLDSNPHDVNTMKQVASVYYNIKKPEEAKTWQKKVLVEDPKDPEAAYTIGAIDWDEANQNVLAMLTPVGLKDDGEGNISAPKWVLETIKAQNGARVEEGLKYLFQALDSRPNYDDAMAYVNLMFRRKADLDWDNETARRDDMTKAIEWTTKAMDARKANEEKKSTRPDPVKQ